MRNRKWSVWPVTTPTDRLEVQVRLPTPGSEMVTVRLVFADGNIEVYNGSMAVERRWVPGEGGLYGSRGRQVISKVTVRSIRDDVSVTDRTMIGAAEAYASAVAQIAVARRDWRARARA